MAFLGDLLVRLGVNTADFQSDMGKAAYVAEKSFKRMENAANTMQAKVIAALGAAVSLNALKEMAAQTLHAGDQFYKMSQKVGIGVESLSGLTYAASLADLEIGGLQMGLKKLSTAMVEANAGSKEQANLFKAIGVSFKDAAGNIKQPEDALLAVADKFAGMRDGAEKSAIAVKLFGKTGLDMIPFLNQGSEAIRAATEEARKFGVVWSKDAAKGAEDFNDNMKRIKSLNDGLAVSLATSLLPLLTSLQEKFLASKDSVGSLHNQLKELFNDRQKMEGYFEAFAVGGAMVADAISSSWNALVVVINGVVAAMASAASIAAKIHLMTPMGAAQNFASGGGLEEAQKYLDALASRADEAARGAAGKLLGKTFTQRTEEAFAEARKNQALRDIFGPGGASSAAGGKPKGVPDLSGIKQGITAEQREKMFLNAQQGLEKQYFSLTKAGQEATLMYEVQSGSLKQLLEPEKEILLALARKIDLYKRQREVADAVQKQLESEEELNKQRNQTLTEQNAAYVQALQDQEFELSLLTKNSREAEVMNAQRRIELDLRKQIAALPRLEEGASPSQIAENQRAIDMLRERAEEQKRLVTDGIQQRQEAERSWAVGVEKGFNDFIDSATNAAQIAHNTVTGALDGMADAVARFATGGKISFKDFANSVIQDIIRVQIKLAAAQAIKGGGAAGIFGSIGKLFGFGGGSSPTAGQSVGAFEASSFLGGVTPFASGGDYFAGRARLIGENGPELDVPRAAGTVIPNMGLMSSGSGMNITVNQTNNIDSRSDMASIIQAMKIAQDNAVAEIYDRFSRGDRA